MTDLGACAPSHDTTHTCCLRRRVEPPPALCRAPARTSSSSSSSITSTGSSSCTTSTILSSYSSNTGGTVQAVCVAECVHRGAEAARRCVVSACTNLPARGVSVGACTCTSRLDRQAHSSRTSTTSPRRRPSMVHVVSDMSSQMASRYASDSCCCAGASAARSGAGRRSYKRRGGSTRHGSRQAGRHRGREGSAPAGHAA